MEGEGGVFTQRCTENAKIPLIVGGGRSWKGWLTPHRGTAINHENVEVLPWKVQPPWGMKKLFHKRRRKYKFGRGMNEPDQEHHN